MSDFSRGSSLGRCGGQLRVEHGVGDGASEFETEVAAEDEPEALSV
ncbi:hypothetical protein ACFWNE_23275 [Streptomyces goshikiensis]